MDFLHLPARGFEADVDENQIPNEATVDALEASRNGLDLGMTLDDDNPIAVFQDRYQGVYSGGAWIAVAEASELVDQENTRAQFCLVGGAGPFGDDVTAGFFWNNPPEWIAVGPTPEAAIEALGNRRKPISAQDT